MIVNSSGDICPELFTIMDRLALWGGRRRPP